MSGVAPWSEDSPLIALNNKHVNSSNDKYIGNIIFYYGGTPNSTIDKDDIKKLLSFIVVHQLGSLMVEVLNTLSNELESLFPQHATAIETLIINTVVNSLWPPDIKDVVATEIENISLKALSQIMGRTNPQFQFTDNDGLVPGQSAFLAPVQLDISQIRNFPGYNHRAIVEGRSPPQADSKLFTSIYKDIVEVLHQAPGTPTQVMVNLDRSSIQLGESVDVTTTVKDQNQNPMNGISVSLSSSFAGSSSSAGVFAPSSNPTSGGAAVQFFPLTEGNITVIATTNQGLLGQAQLTVNQAPSTPTQVTINLDRSSIQLGESVDVTTTVKDQNQNPMNGIPVSLSSSFAGSSSSAGVFAPSSNPTSGGATVQFFPLTEGNITVITTVKDQNQNPMNGIPVNFSSSLAIPGFIPGNFRPSSASTSGGQATVQYEVVELGVITITATTAQGLSGQTQLAVSSPNASITLNVQRHSDFDFTITARVINTINDMGLSHEPIDFTAHPPSLVTWGLVDSQTNSNGFADAFLTGHAPGGSVTITVRSAGAFRVTTILVGPQQAQSLTLIQTLSGSHYPVDWRNNRVATGGNSQDVKVWDTNTWTLTGQATQERAFDDLVFSPNGAKIKWFYIYNTANLGSPISDKVIDINPFGMPRRSNAVDWSVNDEIVIAHDDGIISIVSPGLSLLRNIQVPSGRDVLSVDWSPDGSKFAAGDEGGNVSVFTRTGGQLSGPSIGAGTTDILAVGWHPSHNTLAVSVDTGDQIKIYNTLNWTEDRTIGRNFSKEAEDLEWSHDGTMLAAGSGEGVIAWDATSNYPELFRSPPFRILSIAWADDDTMIAGASDNKVNIYSLLPPQSCDISITSPTHNAQTECPTVTVTGRITCPSGPVSSATIAVNSGTPTSLTLDSSGNFSQSVSLAMGGNNITVKAQTAITQPVEANLVVTRVPDTKQPLISNIAVNSASGLVGTPFTVTARVVDLFCAQDNLDTQQIVVHIQPPGGAHLDQLSMRDDGTSGDQTANDDIFTAVWTSTAAGVYNAEISATDKAGNTSQVTGPNSFTVHGASSGPILSITAPTPNQILPAGTTFTTLQVNIANHPAPGHWRLNSPFPNSDHAGGNMVISGNTATITGLVDGQTYTAYAALVDGNHNLLSPSVTASVTFSVGTAPTLPTLAIVSPTPNQVFPAGTTFTALQVNITNHPAPGHWHWQFGAPFPNSGPAGGNMVLSGTTANITGLADGQTYMVYATLVDGAHNLLNPPVTQSVTFSVDVPLPGPPPPGSANLVFEETYDGLPPGSTVPGWVALEPNKDATLPVVQSTSFNSAPHGGSLTNDFDVSRPFPNPLRGIVTLDFWMDPKVGPDTNNILGLQMGDVTVGGIRLTGKNDSDRWFYNTESGDVFFEPLDGHGHHIRIEWDTETTSYNFFFDRARIGERDHTAHTAGGIVA